MRVERDFTVGDAVLVEGTKNDGKVGTILRCIHDEYLVALEDGTQVLLTAQNLQFRR